MWSQYRLLIFVTFFYRFWFLYLWLLSLSSWSRFFTFSAQSWAYYSICCRIRAGYFFQPYIVVDSCWVHDHCDCQISFCGNAVTRIFPQILFIIYGLILEPCSGLTWTAVVQWLGTVLLALCTALGVRMLPASFTSFSIFITGASLLLEWT